MRDYTTSGKEAPFDRLPVPTDASAIEILATITVVDKATGEILFTEEDIPVYTYSESTAGGLLAQDARLAKWRQTLVGKRVKTFGFTHGFGGKVKSDKDKESWIENAIKLLKAQSEHSSGFDLINFVAFDWRKGAKGERALDCDAAADKCSFTYSLCKYDQAASNTRTVGVTVAKFLHAFANVMPPADVHLVGFSLGAHVMGFAGKQYQFLNGGEAKIGRITGLDPAGPLFNLMPEEGRLAPTDAGFVDAIHTNAGIFGIKICVGHADFWVSKVANDSWFFNHDLPWGSVQPGCTDCNHPMYAKVVIRLVKKLDENSQSAAAQEGEVEETIGMSHFRAHIYYRHTISHPTSFVVAADNNNPIVMGFGCSEQTRGSFNVQLAEWNQK